MSRAATARRDVREGVALLPGFAALDAPQVLEEVAAVFTQAPPRHWTTPGGKQMSVAMSNCGECGWVSDERGYRYAALDPATNRPWPAMPARLSQLANRAAAAAGFNDFRPDVCLLNEYLVGTRLTLHQDRDERDFSQPIVSVSLGLPATFRFGGLRRDEACERWVLEHGDVLVWGGAARLAFHGVLPLAAGYHSLTGPRRINLTFRRAL